MKPHLYNPSKSYKPQVVANIEDVEFLVIDLFCGAGGTSTGFLQAQGKALVIACINHDAKAIESHWLNHPEVLHFEEDIRTVELSPLVSLLAQYRSIYRNAKVVLWASLECTNFSKAKGGQPRDADSRTLAEHLDRYVLALSPEYIQIENVVEFMSWGPLDENGKPISRKSGTDYLRWCKHIDSFGYTNEWRELNSADFGAYTSRNRLFGCFAKIGLPIAWPEPTHSKSPVDNGLFGPQQKWKAVKEVLDFNDEGISIFNRKKPLVDASLERIEAGLIKFVAGGKSAFLMQYNSGSISNRALDTDGPCNTIPTNNRFGLAQTYFLSKSYSGRPEGKVIPVSGPAGTITTFGGQSLINAVPFQMKYNSMSTNGDKKHCLGSVYKPPKFLASYYGNGENVRSVEDPSPTLPTKDRCSLINPVFIQREYKTATNTSIDEPLGTITCIPKANIVKCDPFILNPSHGGHCTGTDVPCVTIVARQDKAPLYLIQFSTDRNISVPVYDCDSKVMVRIKEFMALYGLSDIKMRMLKVSELLPIQGFPNGYRLCGSQTDQKKFIGNSVVPQVVTSWCLAMAKKLNDFRNAA